VNARALALLAIEARVQTVTEDAARQAITAFAGYLAAIITDSQVTTGLELLSRQDVHQALVMTLQAAQRQIQAAVTSGYTAASAAAAAAVSRELKALGHQVPSTLPDLGTGLSRLTADVQTAIGHTQTQIQNLVREAFDGVQPTSSDTSSASGSVTAARVLATNAAVRRAGTALSGRVSAASSVSVYAGSRDTQVALYRQFAQINPYIRLHKTWQVTAADPCPMCDALDGEEVELGEEFDHVAPDAGTARPVWRDLQGPPRHPHCRCQLHLVTD
jgi:hypothetical protein